MAKLGTAAGDPIENSSGVFGRRESFLQPELSFFGFHIDTLPSTVAKDAAKRIGTIEIESREFDLLRRDENGAPLNDVFSWVTRSSDDSRYNIPANKLVETILRFTPDIIGLGEMRRLWDGMCRFPAATPWSLRSHGQCVY